MEAEVRDFPETIRDGDYLVDAGTGEILNHVETAGRFAVWDQSSAEWVLEKVQILDAEAAALQARKKTIIRNLDSMLADVERRRKWWALRFSDELQAWTERELAGKKSRTIKTPFGRLFFKKQPRKLEVTDPDRLLEWAKTVARDAVKQGKEHVNVSEIPAATRELLMGNDEQAKFLRERAGMKLVDEWDKFDFECGVSS